MSKIGLVYTTFYLSWSGVELLSGGGVGWGVKSIFFVKPTYSWAELGFWQLTQVTQVNLGGISLLRCSGYLLCPTVGTAEVYLTFYLVWNLTWWPLAIVSRTSSWWNYRHYSISQLFPYLTYTRIRHDQYHCYQGYKDIHAVRDQS